MALNSGAKLGPYEIHELLGAGGMGEVYLAWDTKLGRNVALKVLPGNFASDAERMARFRREAKVLASLNHSNIASIYGIEESGNTPVLIMELAEGQTLAQKIATSPIPLDEALPIARQIAEGLEYAHEKGVTHRDLKPANIKISPEGKVKVLDFGLAKVLQGDPSSSSDPSSSPTITSAHTQAGLLMGTAAYMSPEQAKGKTVDRRSDVWAFGCVLCEMLSGRPAFRGETVTDTLAAIVRGEPDMELPAGTPRKIRELVQRSFQKDPKQRLQCLGDARVAIDEAISGAPELSIPQAADSTQHRQPAFWAKTIERRSVRHFKQKSPIHA
jgi:eukaryotic-like serine/threonine-protein kinase